VYASWNGATQVAAWKILGGPDAATLRPVASSARAGFETAIPAPPGEREFEVQALDASGRVLGTSPPFSLAR
jgi:hypothetical protein